MNERDLDNLKGLDTYALKQLCHQAIERIYRVPGCKKWFLYLLPILTRFAGYKANRHGLKRAA